MTARTIACAGMLGMFGILAAVGCDGDDKRSAEGVGHIPDQAKGGDITLALVATGLTRPVALVASPDDTGRLFIVDQIGTVRVLKSDRTLQDAPFVDVRDLIVPIMPAYD